MLHAQHVTTITGREHNHVAGSLPALIVVGEQPCLKVTLRCDVCITLVIMPPEDAGELVSLYIPELFSHCQSSSSEFVQVG